ncbi:MAG: family 16 glycoside hydrolase [Balneolaceae bacterium]|nr:family 16 glycoside hydrolase [Balneolaceae bacterium]
MDGKDHPGLSRSSGHIGFLGHGDEVAFRNIQIRDLNVYYPDYSTESGSEGGRNHPPEGFKALFNGENLDGWKGLVANPEKRAEMSTKELADAQEEADRVMQQHWSVRDGILFFDGKGKSLATAKDYKDFEMMLDWKIEPGGDSGVYLRGAPQVQIWDITEWPQGSGGLYNNQENLSEPLVPADNPVGEWNQMRIKMIGERVTVHLNGRLVVPGVVLENYWNREKPIYSSGQIELQAHNTPLYFKNVFIREIPRTESLFNGEDLSGWERVGGNAGSWNASNELLYTEGDGEEWKKGAGGGWLSTTEMYDNFKLELEYRLSEGGNSGVFLRAPREGDPAFNGLEIQLLDDYSDQYRGLKPWQYTGSIYDVKAPSKRVTKQAGEWQKMVIIADGSQIKVTLNDEMIINTNLINHLKKVNEHPGLKRRKGYIGLQNHNSRVEFRNVRITEIK